MTTAEIAAELGISPNTVNWHLENALKKIVADRQSKRFLSLFTIIAVQQLRKGTACLEHSEGLSLPLVQCSQHTSRSSRRGTPEHLSAAPRGHSGGLTSSTASSTPGTITGLMSAVHPS